MPTLLARTACWLAALALPLAALAQRPAPDRMPAVPMRPDSLRARLARPGLPDTTRVKYLLRFGALYLSSNQDSSRYYARQALTLAQRRGFDWGAARAWATLGAVAFYATDIAAAQQAFEQVLRLGRRLPDPLMVGRAYIGLGNIANNLHNDPAFLAYYTQARQAYATCRPRYVSGELLVAANLTNYYLLHHQPALARQALRSVPALLRLQPTPAMEGLYFAHLGAAQNAQHQPDSARLNWQRAVQVARAAHLTDLEAENLRHLAELALDQHRPALALPYTQQAAHASRAWADPAGLAKALRLQADALAALHRPGAYDTLSQYATLRDTLLTRERLDAVATAQARFDRAGQETRIAGLEKDRRIQALETERRTTRTRLLATLGTGAALLLLAGVVLGYRRRQRRREAALRQRLAADLHDDVGNLLTQISLQSNLLRENPNTPEQLLLRLDQLASTAHQTARQMNDVIWSLGDESQTLPQLIARMRDHAREMLAPTAIELDFQVDDGLTGTELSPEVRQNLYLIFKESLHNVVKHAHGATLVQVRLDRAAGQVLLRVQDNGRAPAGSPSRLGGNGLRNMHTRAEALGGTLVARPTGGGFEVQVALPG